MLSKWFDLKPDAFRMRKSGKSIRNIEKYLGIPRSTLSGWLKDISLTQKQKYQLNKNHLEALKKARSKAALLHKQQKEERLKKAEEQALKLLAAIDVENGHIQKLALAMLYLGEGIKTNEELGIGNSNPLILNFFIKVLETQFGVDRKKLRCELYLRADQQPNIIKKYWSNNLSIPLTNFKYIHLDKRTIGSKTYQSYKGVCLLRCGNVTIKRKLLYFANRYCKDVISNGRLAQR